MATGTEIVVTLGGRLVEPGRPLVHADDPTFLRGDGIFETLLLRAGRPALLDAHLDRLGRSAAIVGLPDPDPARWRAVVEVATAHWSGAGDAVVRLVLGRGRGDSPTAFVTVSALPARVLAARRDGVSATTLDRGVAGRAPWSIAAAKSLSYAVSVAALREAERLGFDDVVFVGGDAEVLEGPRSTVVIADADGVLLTPPATLPILAGTTVQALFDAAGADGVECRRQPLRVTDLAAAQGIWLVSSVTLAARVHTLDGSALAAAGVVVDVPGLVDRAITTSA